ncbi:hypothetical protein YQE_05362, partial [Dendroctonus ponderosae]
MAVDGSCVMFKQAFEEILGGGDLIFLVNSTFVYDSIDFRCVRYIISDSFLNQLFVDFSISVLPFEGFGNTKIVRSHVGWKLAFAL